MLFGQGKITEGFYLHEKIWLYMPVTYVSGQNVE